MNSPDPATTPAPQKITPQSVPVFPCWVWMRPDYAQFSPAGWSHHERMHGDASQLVYAGWTHWLPDGPEPTCTPTEGEGIRCDKPLPNAIQQPTHSAQEAAERAAEAIWAGDYRAPDSNERAAHVAAIAKVILRHFPSTPTQSQQPPLSPGSGEAMREEIARLNALVSEATMQAQRDAKRADANAAECSRLRACLKELSETDWTDTHTGGNETTEYRNFVHRTALNALAQPATPPLTSGEERTERSAEGAHLDVLFEARDTVQASTVESGISDDRKRYRQNLLVRLNDALTDISRRRLAHPPSVKIGDGKDGERLDWLEENTERGRGTLELGITEDGNVGIWIQHSDKDYAAGSGGDIRAAIDAAMSVQSPQSGREEKPL